MEKKKSGEELQNRREFFKRAAKWALPILAAAVLAGTPSILHASSEDPTGCNGSCSYGCGAVCSTSCSGGCKGGCGGACSYGCQNTCKGTCQGGCSMGCRSMNYN